MNRFTFTGCIAVITGASSGIGAEFARQLAPQAAAIALVARRTGEMETLAATLRAQRPALQVHIFSCDLADADARIRLAGQLDAAGLRPTLLINNAGHGDYGELATADWPRTDSMIQVNITALTHLTHLLLPVLETAGPSAILNVSSLAGELPMPDIAVYAATKAYVTSLTEALRVELRARGITVSALCPGPVHTGFSTSAKRSGGTGPSKWSAVQPVEKVVREALQGIVSGRALTFPGWNVKAICFAVRNLPRSILRLALNRRPRKCGA